MDDKYVVFKRADWDRLVEEKGLKDPFGLEQKYGLPAGSFFVIRSQDRFAPGGLDGYASTMHACLSFAQDLGVDIQGRADAYLDLADEIHGLSYKWSRAENRKFPD
jgi:hypothetical protein